MSKKDDERFSWLTQELLATEYDPTRDEEDMDDEIDEDSAVFVDVREERKKKRERAGLVFMALVTLGLVGVMIRWWITWHN